MAAVGTAAAKLRKLKQQQQRTGRECCSNAMPGPSNLNLLKIWLRREPAAAGAVCCCYYGAAAAVAASMMVLLHTQQEQ